MSFKCELLFSIFIPIYFSIIDIRKYVIKKIMNTCNICNTSPWACNQHMTIITKTKAPEAID